MSTKSVAQVQYTHSFRNEPIIAISDKTAKQLKLSGVRTVHLRLGSARHTVFIRTEAKGDRLRIGAQLAKSIGIPDGVHLVLRYIPETNSLSVGPLIGILMSRTYSNPDRPFGSNTAFCQEVTLACQQSGGIVYFFTPKEIKSNANSLKGWFYHGSWQQMQFPIPHVVYNRLNSRKLENKTSVQQFMKDVKLRYRGTVFNEKYLNKTEVFDALKKDASLASLLPQSYLLKNYDTLKTMAAKHHTLFLKPIRGSLGKGIIRITRRPGQWVSQQNRMNGIQTATYSSLSQLFKQLAGKLKSTRYQIQQGIQLITVTNRPVDFRALVQKNNKGKWEITSIVARIAGNQNFVSNLARGGTLSRVGPALVKSNLPASGVKKVQARIKAAALALAKGVEEQIPFHFGELGVDLAVDRTGKVWLLEINSKPSKNDDTSLNPDKVRPSVKSFVQYCKYLSEF